MRPNIRFTIINGCCDWIDGKRRILAQKRFMAQLYDIIAEVFADSAKVITR